MSLHPNLQPQGSGKQRGVIYEPSWDEAAAAIDPDAKRFDEMCEGLNWRMENAADGCPQLSGSPFRVARAKDPSGALIRGYFTIDEDDMVHAWHVDRTPESEEEDSSSF